MRPVPAAAVAAALVLGALVAAPAGGQVQSAHPIPASGPRPSTPGFVGHAATPRPLAGVRPAWTNPFMARNPVNSVHNDPWQSDAYTQFGGPLGRSPRAFSAEFGRTCITLTFDRRGRLVATCTNLDQGPALYLFDPVTLDTLAFLQLPFVPPPAGSNPALNTTGGAYFFLDHRDRAVIATADRRIAVIGQRDDHGTPRFRRVATYDPTPCLAPGDRMPSTLPDARGRLWFVGRTNGTVGVLDPRTGRCRSIVLHEEIENSFAVASDGVYVVTDRAQYKFRAGDGLRPRTIWRARYRNVGTQKTGQINAGSGTTPTLIAGFGRAGRRVAPAYVAITDNADPMDVVVLRAADRLRRGQRRVVCTVPVFAKGASATENSLVSAGRSLYVENNFGYDITRFNDVIAGGQAIGGDRSLVSSPGFARVEVNRAGTRCRKVWENDRVRAPSVVPKADTRNGLVYTFENVKDPEVADADPWYWTALDARTGRVVWRKLAGWGGQYNNHYAGIALGRAPRTGLVTAYVGGVGGVMALRDR
jgi:hypothetical protein